MNRAIEWFAENKVAANLLMMFIIIAGLLTFQQVKIEIFPDTSTDTITISMIYLGAAPEEVEEGVCVKIEEAIQGIEGVKKLISAANEGMGSVTVEVKDGYDVQEVLDEVKLNVDAITTFPHETEKPVIKENVIRRQVINVAVYGDADERSLKTIGEKVRDEITDIDGISQVDLTIARTYEISIEVSEEALRRYALTFDEVAQAVQLSSLDLPGGSIKTEGGEILLRTKGQAYRGREYEKLALRSLPDGTRLTLGDIAKVVDGFADTDIYARFDGKPAVLVKVYRVGDENALTVANAVKEYIEKTKDTLPDGISLTTWQDMSIVLKDRISLLLRNGRAGFFLVFLALALFLRLKLSLWVTVGMIVSFLGAFWIMPQFDVSLNMISLFAFILVLGIVVDDAIVIGENIYSRMEQGQASLKAAISGAQSVAVPVVFAVLTTVAAFFPLLGVAGFMGKIMRNIPIIVIATLMFSLIESLFILPAHLSHINIHKEKKSKFIPAKYWDKLQNKISNNLEIFITKHYRKVLRSAITKRYLTIAIGIAMLVISAGFVGGGFIKFIFMPEIEADNVIALLTMPQGTPAEVTTGIIHKIERCAKQIEKEYSEKGGNPVVHSLSTIGGQPYRTERPMAHGVSASTNDSHLGEVNLQLQTADVRTVSSQEIARRWRELVGKVPGVEELTFTSSLFSAGEPVNIQLAGSNYAELQLAAEELKELIAQYSGVFDITDSYRDGKEEIKLHITPEGEALGLTLSNLARQVRQAFYGAEAQRIQRGRDDIRVMVRYPEGQRKSKGDLENMRIRIPGGGEVPFSIAATVQEGTGYSTINRTNRKRTVNITADVDLSVANPNEIISDITANVLPGFLEKYSGLTYSLEGEQNEQQESLADLKSGYIFALLLIYVLLAIPFRSYIQPIIVMSSIPFGLVGALLGHLIMGMDLTLIGVFGIVALAGVVVNDSLVLVDFINRERKAGKPVKEAIIESGVNRFRPIMLTSITTFAGLTPLLMEKSLQAQFLIPMAISLGFGVLFATFITLLIVPSIYHVLEDARDRVTLWIRKLKNEPAETVSVSTHTKM